MAQELGTAKHQSLQAVQWQWQWAVQVLKLWGGESSLTREVVVPRGWTNHYCFFVSLSSCNMSWTQMQLLEVQGRKEKTRAFDFGARGLGRGPKEARKCQWDHREKGAQDSNSIKLYRTGLTSKLHIDLTLNNLPNTLRPELQGRPLPRPRLGLQGGAQGDHMQLAIQRLWKLNWHWNHRPQEQAETCNLKLTCWMLVNTKQNKYQFSA